MLIQILTAILLGVFAGTITGLIPGIHVNLVSVFLVTISPFLLRLTAPITLACFIISMATVHTFLDAIPAIFLGAPDASTSLNVLPGHKFLEKGRGYEAVKLTLTGSLLSLIITAMLVPIAIFFVPIAYPWIRYNLSVILVIVMAFMIAKEPSLNKKFWGFILLLLAGALGLVVLNMHNLKNPLFPMLSGFFGIPLLILALYNKTIVPEQTTECFDVSWKQSFKAVFAAVISGCATATVPGVGAATAALIASQFFRKSLHTLMIVLGGVTTTNFVFSLATLFAVDKARNGAIVAVLDIVSVLRMEHAFLFIACILSAGGIAAILGIVIAKSFAMYVTEIRYDKLCVVIICFIASMSYVLSGAIGLLVLITSTGLGISISLLGVKRSIGMGCLMIPVVMYFMM